MWQLLVLPVVVALRTLEPTPEGASSARNNVIEGWLNVRLNHFSAFDNNTFPMRYYYNDALVSSSPDSDVVIFVGGEWAISPTWVTAGLPYEFADMTGAAVFYTEHRYYGLTRPSADTSVADLRFLTVDQALGDLAQFIHYIKSDDFESGRYKNGKVSLYGCSYAGSMATWMRLGYPHLVDAVLSDSGPLHAQEDFPEYLEVITEALRTQGSQQCVDSIQEAMLGINSTLQSTQGAATVSSLFNTCAALDQNNPLDLATFYWFGITETFAYLVQYATPGDIAEACSTITDASIQDPMTRLANWVRAYRNACIESRYSEVVAAHTDLSYDAPDSVMRLWTYQTCVEYGWYQTTTSDDQPFLNAVPLEYFHQMCRDFFSNYFSETLLRSGIERTNALFGGLTHLPDKSVSIAGGADPWSPMGPQESHGRDSAPVYVVPDVSHCRAIRGGVNHDTEELGRVKFAAQNKMHEFLYGVPFAGASAAAASALLAAAGVVIALLR